MLVFVVNKVEVEGNTTQPPALTILRVTARAISLNSVGTGTTDLFATTTEGSFSVRINF
jgi:hypothetical protein